MSGTTQSTHNSTPRWVPPTPDHRLQLTGKVTRSPEIVKDNRMVHRRGKMIFPIDRFWLTLPTDRLTLPAGRLTLPADRLTLPADYFIRTSGDRLR